MRQVVNELRGEKVDIVPWREDTKSFIAEALSPAKVRQVILDDDEMQAIVVVPDRELSLAIGKEGQNARLAARLSGYRIDIRSETEQAGGGDEEEPAEPAAAATDAAESVATEVAEASETEATETEATEATVTETMSDDDSEAPGVEDDEDSTATELTETSAAAAVIEAAAAAADVIEAATDDDSDEADDADGDDEPAGA